MAMEQVVYYTTGICAQTDRVGELSGFTEVILYNPSGRPVTVEQTIYFTDAKRGPVLLEGYVIPACSSRCQVMPDLAPEVFRQAGFWGSRVKSDGPLVVYPIGGLFLHHPDNRYKWGCPSYYGTTLHRQWLYADGLWQRTGVREPEDGSPLDWQTHCCVDYHFLLNPGKVEAQATLNVLYETGEKGMIQVTVPPERLLVWTNEDQVRPDVPHSLIVKSSQPISASAQRCIQSCEGIGKWGRTPQFGLPGLPVD